MNSFPSRVNTCEAVVVTCIDFRFQRLFEWWLRKRIGQGTYDRIAWAGGVKDWVAVSRQIEVAKRLHDIKKVYLVNHEDCGAYGSEASFEQHRFDLLQARDSLLMTYPDVEVRLFYAKLPNYKMPNLSVYLQKVR